MENTVRSGEQAANTYSRCSMSFIPRYCALLTAACKVARKISADNHGVQVASPLFSNGRDWPAAVLSPPYCAADSSSWFSGRHATEDEFELVVISWVLGRGLVTWPVPCCMYDVLFQLTIHTHPRIPLLCHS